MVPSSYLTWTTGVLGHSLCRGPTFWFSVRQLRFDIIVLRETSLLSFENAVIGSIQCDFKSRGQYFSKPCILFQAIMHHEGHMDDGLTLSRSQHEESRTARVIRSTVFLFNLFIRWITARTHTHTLHITQKAIDAIEKYGNKTLAEEEAAVCTRWD